MKRALEEMEEDNNRLASSKRRVQRELDEMSDQVETLQRELRTKSTV